MTAIAIWLNGEYSDHPSLWAAADSRVSGSGGNLLIGDAVKIFSLPIICKKPVIDGFFSDKYYVHTVGYCFAGSTLMGQNAYLGMSPLLSNLISVENYIPSLEDVADYIHKYLILTFKDYCVAGGMQSLFEVAVFGFCHRSKRLEIYHFRTEIVNGSYEVVLRPYQNLNDKDFLYLGDDRASLSAAITRAFNAAAEPGRPISRAPRYVIEDRIASSQNQTIGGDVQLAVANEFGFQPYMLCKPVVKGEAKAVLSYLGRELSQELSFVGESMVAVHGML